MTERGNTTLVVIIVIVLALFIAGYFASSRTFWDTFNLKEFLRLPCGITIDEPKPDSKAVFPVKVDGYINGCGWIPDAKLMGGRSGGTAQVFDGKGLPVTKPIMLLIDDSSGELPLHFSNELPLFAPPTTDTGNILFTSSTGLIFSIPISF